MIHGAPSSAFDPDDEWDPGNPQNREQTRSLQIELRARLLQWDPIGVGAAPEALDEYDCMISPLMHMLHDGGSVRGLEAWISSEQRDHFGLSPNVEADRRLAADLVQWWNAKTAR